MDSNSVLSNSSLSGSPAVPRGNGHAVQPARNDTLCLDPSLSLQEAARRVFRFHFNRMIENEAGTRTGNSPDALHDMRVATRRLRAAFRDFKEAFGDSTLDPFVEDVRWLAQLLGRIRDSDVFLQWLKDYANTAPASDRPTVDRVIRERQTARARARAALLDALDSSRYLEFKAAFAGLVETDIAAAPASPGSGPSLLDWTNDKIRLQCKRVLKKGRRANLKHLKRLHRLRIEFKRLRYTGEFFSSLYPKGLRKLIKKSTRLQDTLGVIHDADVQSTFLREMQEKQEDNLDADRALGRMIRALEKQEKQHYKDFRIKYRAQVHPL